MKTYRKVYFSLCLFSAISGRSRTQLNLHIGNKSRYTVLTTLHRLEHFVHEYQLFRSHKGSFCAHDGKADSYLSGDANGV